MVISSIFIGLAAIFNAIMDRLENENFSSSVFKNLNPKFWYKRESWMYAKKVFGYKIDGWHLAKSAMIISLVLAILFNNVQFNLTSFILYGLEWNIVFVVFYSRILKK